MRVARLVCIVVGMKVYNAPGAYWHDKWREGNPQPTHADAAPTLPPTLMPQRVATTAPVAGSTGAVRGPWVPAGIAAGTLVFLGAIISPAGFVYTLVAAAAILAGTAVYTRRRARTQPALGAGTGKGIAIVDNNALADDAEADVMLWARQAAGSPTLARYNTAKAARAAAHNATADAYTADVEARLDNGLLPVDGAKGTPSIGAMYARQTAKALANSNLGDSWVLYNDYLGAQGHATLHIDHILYGPAGAVLVVNERMGKVWEDGGKGYRNLTEVRKQLMAAHPGLPVYGVYVPNEGNEGGEAHAGNGITRMDRPYLAGYISNLPPVGAVVPQDAFEGTVVPALYGQHAPPALPQ